MKKILLIVVLLVSLCSEYLYGAKYIRRLGGLSRS